MQANLPWYREPWPWLLMAGPATVVVAGIVTAVLAVRSFDGMVADDYYKQGLAINRQIERDERAKALGVHAELDFATDRRRVVVTLRNDPRAPTLRLAISHPTRPSEDQSVVLARNGRGYYEGTLRAPVRGKLDLVLEDPHDGWRLTGEWRTQDDVVAIAPH